MMLFILDIKKESFNFIYAKFLKFNLFKIIDIQQMEKPIEKFSVELSQSRYLTNNKNPSSKLKIDIERNKIPHV